MNSMYLYISKFIFMFLLFFLIIGKPLSGVPKSKKPFGLLHMFTLPNLRTKASFSGVYCAISLKFGREADIIVSLVYVKIREWYLLYFAYKINWYTKLLMSMVFNI